MKLFFATVLLLSGFAASADQCAWNSSSDANSAMALINLHKEVMHFCQNCGDDKPSFIAKVDAVKTAKVSGEKAYRTVTLISGKQQQEVDLAYLYVRTASDMFANVAQLVGCPSEGAVTFIQTTNKNQKIQHYYNAEGVRVNTAESTAQIGTGFKTRVPANTKK